MGKEIATEIDNKDWILMKVGHITINTLDTETEIEEDVQSLMMHCLLNEI